MTYSLFGNWTWNGGSKGSKGSKGDDSKGGDGPGIYNADISPSNDELIDNPGGAFDDKSIRTMQQNVDKDSFVYLDGTGQDTGETVDLRYDSKGDDVDTVVVDVNDFSGDFYLNVTSLQTIDKLYMSNVISFAGVDKDGNPITPVYTANNVLGGGETGDQNGGEFGDGSYKLQEPGNGAPANYQITYIDRDGNEQTITLKVHVDGGDETNISIDFTEPPICFAAGTMVVVKGGAKAVENLRPGDLVLTKDNGFQPLRWMATRSISATEMARNSDLRPIRIRAGALGPNLPETDLVVSPQHRMLLRDWRCEALFGEDEALAPAKALVNDSTITVDYDCEEVVYVHFMFEQHEIVYANGVESESFHPGEFGLSTLNEAARKELFTIFPHLEADVSSFGAPARPVLRAFEARAMMSA